MMTESLSRPSPATQGVLKNILNNSRRKKNISKTIKYIILLKFFHWFKSYVDLKGGVGKRWIYQMGGLSSERYRYHDEMYVNLNNPA